MTFSCKDDCTMTRHTRCWTYSARDVEIPLCHIPPLQSFFWLQNVLGVEIFILVKRVIWPKNVMIESVQKRLSQKKNITNVVFWPFIFKDAPRYITWNLGKSCISNKGRHQNWNMKKFGQNWLREGLKKSSGSRPPPP